MADRKDEQSVLGNLPRARPGQRSSKRGGGASASPSARAKAVRAKTAARRKPATKRATKPKVTATSAPKTTIEPPRDEGGTDPITGAIQLAGKVAGIGLKTAGAVLRRLPGI